MLFGVIDIMFSCTPRVATSVAMVPKNRARWPAVVSSEPPEAVKHSMNRRRNEKL